jgi:hypothetical protein
MLTAHIRDQLKRINDAIRLFAQLFSAIVGGMVILRVEHPDTFPRILWILSDIFVLFVLVVCTAIIVDNLCAWCNYRKTLSNIAGTVDRNGKPEPIIPLPTLSRPPYPEIVTVIIMVIATVCYWIISIMAACGCIAG